MTDYGLSGAAAIVGVGATAFGRFPERSAIALGVESLKNALDDAGLERADVDGLMINMGYPVGIDYDQFCTYAGLETRLNLQLWTHGRWLATVVEQAAAAVALGLARCVAIVNVTKFSVLRQLGGAEDHEASREGGGSHGEAPHIGVTGPGSGAAFSARLYMERYGISEAQLGKVPVHAREAGRRNPAAWMTKPLTIESYLESRYIIEPLRVHDFAQVTDGSCTVLVMAAAAPPATRRPVPILGTQGIQAGPAEFIFGRPGLGVQQQPMTDFAPSERDVAIYGRSGIERADVDALYTYDAFSPLVWFTLERLGFCGEGEAPELFGSGLPVNTHGGLLSEAHVSGFNHVVEMVRQVRGEAGDRQLAQASVVQWGTAFGDSFVLGEELR
jgi:acetyl-CoA acetyltransferase